MPRVQCIKCGRTGNLTTKKTKSHGTTYEYYYVQHYIKETDKIEWCYLGNSDKLPPEYKDKLWNRNLHTKNLAIHETVHTQTAPQRRAK